MVSILALGPWCLDPVRHNIPEVIMYTLLIPILRDGTAFAGTLLLSDDPLRSARVMCAYMLNSEIDRLISSGMS